MRGCDGLIDEYVGLKRDTVFKAKGIDKKEPLLHYLTYAIPHSIPTSEVLLYIPGLCTEEITK